MNQAEFERRSGVSRETISDYVQWEQLLRRWNARINLVAPNSLAEFWGRHALDSWQICPLLPENPGHIVDFGSGAGFPGIAASIHCKHVGQGRVTMVESAGKKASFLKTVVRELGLPAKVSSDRIEALAPQVADIITARAFAPLPRLLRYAEPHMTDDTQFILLKGENVDEELEMAQDEWTFDLKTVKSQTDENAAILLLSHVKAK